MCETCDYTVAKRIMNGNFIGLEELRKIEPLSLLVPDTPPEIPFSTKLIEKKKKDYLMILGVDKFFDGSPITIRNIQRYIGKDPDTYEPCFYNQDWYIGEKFIDLPIEGRWYFIRKNVYEDTRAESPQELIKKYRFPSAISCTYAFFAAWFALNIKLWYHDFVWCSDVDHNGDRIYVGKYHDIDGINKNGFSIHRHLALRSCYACID